MPYLRRTASIASGGAGAKAATSTPSGVTWTRSASTSCDASRSVFVEADGTMTPAARCSQRSNRRRHRGSMCGAVSGRCSWARSCTTITTPGLWVAGGRKFVASSTSNAPDHSIRGTPSRVDMGPNTRAGNREAFSVRLGAFTPSKNRRGRNRPLACRYHATYSLSGSACGRCRMICCV